MPETMAERTNVTAEEFLAMGGGHRELVRGRVVEMTPAGTDHGGVAARVTTKLSVHAETHDSGRVYTADTGFRLRHDPDTVRAPDVAFLAKARVVRTRKFFEGAPDLAVEVLSPSALASEVRTKVREYLVAGARLVWIVDPESRTASVHRPDGTGMDLGEDGTLDGEDLLPGLRIALAELFAD